LLTASFTIGSPPVVSYTQKTNNPAIRQLFFMEKSRHIAECQFRRSGQASRDRGELDLGGVNDSNGGAEWVLLEPFLLHKRPFMTKLVKLFSWTNKHTEFSAI
jgi:hypothetical protein